METAENVSLKSEMRSATIKRRNAIDPEERSERSRAICERVFTELGEVPGDPQETRVAVFSSFGSEVALDRFEELGVEAGYRLCYPAMIHVAESDRPVMEFFELPVSLVRKKDVGFLVHPARAYDRADVVSCGCDPVRHDEIDFALVPLVAFDDQGGRLGYGGGNYDAFLAQRRREVRALGIAFSEQRVACVPREVHDLPLDGVVAG